MFLINLVNLKERRKVFNRPITIEYSIICWLLGKTAFASAQASAGRLSESSSTESDDDSSSTGSSDTSDSGLLVLIESS